MPCKRSVKIATDIVTGQLSILDVLVRLKFSLFFSERSLFAIGLLGHRHIFTRRNSYSGCSQTNDVCQ